MAVKNNKWGGAPQESNTPGSRPGWGGAPQESNTPGSRPGWGGAPQESNTGLNGNSVPLSDTPEYSFYIIEGITYKVKRVLSAQSGEAKIFQIENDKKDFALKLYRPGVKPNHEVLDKVMKLRGNGLLIDIYAHGTWHDDITGADLDYEIMQYLGGGSLANLRLNGDEKRMKEIAAGMAAALDFAHKHGILHRDVKPANFLFADSTKKRFVLTDWGLAKMLDDKGRTVTDSGRTKIYAAPEMYTFIPGTPTYVDAKADFFSMGMALLALWKGEGNLIADERRLVHDKQEETLPYPQKGEISEHLLSLIKALTRRNPEKRAGFDDIVRWAKGEIIFKDDKADAIGEYRIVFSSTDNLIAHNNAELAQMMETNPELAKKYLYTDTLTKKFREIDRPEIAVELEEITEMRYPDDRDAGLYAAILLLDPEKPYIGSDGKECRTQKEIAREIFNKQEKYGNALSSSSHKLWIYLESSGLGKQIKGMAKSIKVSPLGGVRKLCYMLDTTLPYPIDIDGAVYDINTLDEYADLYMLKKVKFGFQTSDDFLTWLATRNKTLAGKAKSMIAEHGSGYFGALCVHYAILPDRGYDLLPLGESLMADQKGLALMLIGELDGSIQSTSLTGVREYLTSVSEFSTSPLRAYLLSKAIYESHIKYIEYCLDFKSEDNQLRYGPYNLRIAQFKIASGLLSGEAPLTINGVDIHSPSEIRRVGKITNNDANIIADWTAIFYQENPYADYKKRSYYNLTADYYKFIANNLPQCDYCRRAESKTGGYVTIAWDAIKAWRKVSVVKWLMGVLCLIPMVLALGLCSYVIVTDGVGPVGEVLKSVGWWVAVIAGVCAGLLVWSESGLLLGVIAYFVVAAVIKVVFSFLSTIAPWLLVAIILIIIVYFCRVIFRKTIAPLPDQVEGFGLYEAFERTYIGAAFNSRSKVLPGMPDNMPVEVLKDNRRFAGQALSKMIRHMLYMLLITAVGVYFCAWIYSDKPLAEEKKNTELSLQGSYKGDVEGTPSDITLQVSESGAVSAYMTISYRSGTTEQRMEGSVNGQFPVVLSKIDNAAIYLTIDTAFVNEGVVTLLGSYVNSKGNTRTINYQSNELQKMQ